MHDEDLGLGLNWRFVFSITRTSAWFFKGASLLELRYRTSGTWHQTWIQHVAQMKLRLNRRADEVSVAFTMDRVRTITNAQTVYTGVHKPSKHWDVIASTCTMFTVNLMLCRQTWPPICKIGFDLEWYNIDRNKWSVYWIEKNIFFLIEQHGNDIARGIKWTVNIVSASSPATTWMQKHPERLGKHTHLQCCRFDRRIQLPSLSYTKWSNFERTQCMVHRPPPLQGTRDVSTVGNGQLAVGWAWTCVSKKRTTGAREGDA